jgi:hypothetical protein
MARNDSWTTALLFAVLLVATVASSAVSFGLGHREGWNDALAALGMHDVGRTRDFTDDAVAPTPTPRTAAYDGVLLTVRRAYYLGSISKGGATVVALIPVSFLVLEVDITNTGKTRMDVGYAYLRLQDRHGDHHFPNSATDLLHSPLPRDVELPQGETVSGMVAYQVEQQDYGFSALLQPHTTPPMDRPLRLHLGI